MRPILSAPIRVFVALGFLTISGALALVMPLAWATLFGLRTEDAQALAFARVAGAREVVLAMIAFVLVHRGVTQAAIVTIGLSILIGVADFAVVSWLRGSGAVLNLAIFHAGGIILLTATWLSLRHRSG